MRSSEAYIDTWQEGEWLRCGPAPEFQLKLYHHYEGEDHAINEIHIIYFNSGILRCNEAGQI